MLDAPAIATHRTRLARGGTVAAGARHGYNARMTPSLQSWRRPLGNSGLAVSPIALGCWPIAGVTTLDTNEADSIATILAGDDRPYRFGSPRLWQARIAAVKGNREGAVALIRQAMREGYARLYLLHAEHDFDSLRSFPAFREIVRPR